MRRTATMRTDGGLAPSSAPPVHHVPQPVPFRFAEPGLEAALHGAALAAVGLVTRSWLLVIVSVLAAALAHSLGGRYSRPRLSFDGDRVWLIVGLPLAAVAVTGQWADVPSHTVVTHLGLAAALSGAARIAFVRVLTSLRRNGTWTNRCLVVGTADEIGNVVALLEGTPETGLRCVGCLPATPMDDDVTSIHQLEPHQLVPYVLDRRVTRIILCNGGVLHRQVLHALEELRGVEILLALRHLETNLVARTMFDHVRGVPFGWLRFTYRRRLPRMFKRTLDVAVSGIALVLAAPIMGAAALAVKLSSPGPVLFRQERVGRHGELFELLKFRSMRVGAQPWSAKGSSQVTKVGGFLRRTAIDELPQLWNILAGHMSIVGPRPERPEFSHEFSGRFEGYQRRLRSPVGLTGLAQVNGLRGDTSIPERARFDNLYIERWTPGLEMTIIVRTATAVVRQGKQ